MNLPPLNQVDPDGLKLGKSESTELNFSKCKHELYLVSGTEARCKKCSAGWMGSGILKLINASKPIANLD